MNEQIHLTALQFKTNKAGDITQSILSNSQNMASIRIQLMPALRAIEKKDGSFQVLSLHSEKPAALSQLKPSKICLIAKMSANSEHLTKSMVTANLAAITRLKRLGSKIVILYSDNLIAKDPETREFYLDIFKAADFMVYPSRALFEMTRTYLHPKCKAMIIRDPWQLNQSYTSRPLSMDQACRIIWFGNNSNIDYLIKSMRSMMSKSDKKECLN